MSTDNTYSSRSSTLQTRRLADWTRIIAIFTIILGGFTALLAATGILQWQAMVGETRQQYLVSTEEIREMKAENRPIVAIDLISAVGPITFDKDGASILFNVDMENVGHQTAQFVDIEGSLTSEEPPGDVFADKSCANRRSQKSDTDLGGKAIWPGRKLGLRQVMLLDKDGYRNWLAEWNKGVTDEPIWLFGCVDYVFDGQHHQTAFVREVDRSVADTWDEIDPRKGALAPSQIILLQHPVIAEVSD